MYYVAMREKEDRGSFLKRLFEREKTFKRFGEQERQALKKAGAIICRGTGKTLIDLKGVERKISWVLKKKEFKEYKIVHTPSHVGEMAFFPNPRDFFVPGSLGKTLLEQEKLVKSDSEYLRKNLGVNGLEVVIPKEAATLVELAYFYFGVKMDWLFARSYQRHHARTKQYTDSNHTLEVGFANKKDGLVVLESLASHRDAQTGVVRLIIPR